ncbi:MAG: PVC-type heme-binding CxxCH protein [Planctomycetaceae bacterium]
MNSFAVALHRSICCLGLAACVTPAIAHDFPKIVNTQRDGEHPPTPAEAAAKFTAPPGFHVTLFAGEPDVAQPIAIDFDDRGRLLAAECYTFAGQGFDAAHRDRIVIFHDVDGDGRHDERRVFWNGGNVLTGLAWGFDGVWVLNHGTLSHISDRNHDDVPDNAPVVHLDGFNIEDVEHNVVSGMIWGPDGWLYGRHGILATSRPGVPGTPLDERPQLNCGIWRYHPTRHVFEVVARGTTNPWGLDYDEHGQFFFTNNVTGHAWHLIPGAHYKRMYGEDFNPHLYELLDQHADHYHWDTTGEWTASREGANGADALGGGHSHCGGMIYLGDNWPQEYRGGLFMCNTHGRRVNHDIPVREGSGYVLKHAKDVLFANQPWFRGISLAYGPDGGVYVTDWSDFGECHDHDGVHRTSGRIYKITYGTPKPLPKDFDLAKLSDEQLVGTLDHPNQWHVRRARRLLQERAANDSGEPRTRQRIAAQSSQPVGVRDRVELLWALHATGGVDRQLLVEMLHTSSNEDVRAWAVRLLTDEIPVASDAAEVLARRAGAEESSFVRLHLASAMQRIEGEPRWKIAEALAMHGEDVDDHNLPLMIWYGLEPLVPTDVERSIRIAETTPIALLRRHVARRIASLGDDSPESLPKLMELIGRLKTPADRGDVVAGIAAALRGARQLTPPAGWSELRDELVDAKDAAVSVPAKELAVVFGDGRTMDQLKVLAADGNAAPDARRHALDVLIRSGDKSLAMLLHRLITDRATAAVAVRGLAAVGTDETPKVLLENFGRMPKDAQPEVISTLAVREIWALALLDGVAGKAVPKELVTASTARQMASLGSEKVAERLSEVWGTVRSAPEAVKAEIERMRGELTPVVLAQADLANGRGLYNRMCGNCHKLYGEGAEIAPDLTGSNRSNLDYLLENMLDPSGTVPEAYRSAVVVLTDGRVLTGVVVSKSNNRLTLQTATEKLTLDRADVEEVKVTDQSLMPNGQLDRLSPEEVRDLIAYLSGKGQVPIGGE